MAGEWPHLPAYQSEGDATDASPSGWAVQQINSLFDKLPIGKRFDQKSSFPSGRIPVVDQSRDGYVGFHDEAAGVEASIAAPVVTFANHTCEMRVMRCPFSVIQNVFPMIGKRGVCDSLFFYYATKGRVHLEEYKGHYPDYRRLWIPLPPLPEQKRIAHILGTLDDKIELNRRMNATLDAISRAIFKSWFVDFDPVRQKATGKRPVGMGTQTAALFPDSFEESEIGAVPKGWRIGSILEQASLLSGGTPKTDEPSYWGGCIPWASAKDVSQCGEAFLTATERGITQAGVDNSSTKIIPAYTTVIVSRGATTGRLTMLAGDMAMNQTCYGLNSRIDTPLSLYCCVQSFIRRMVAAAHGSVFDTITTKTFETTPVLLVPPRNLVVFEEAVADVFARVRNNLIQSRTLAALRDTLLPKLLSGEVRVPEVEEVVEGVLS
jgi:type I restriction enzyme S subunit